MTRRRLLVGAAALLCLVAGLALASRSREARQVRSPLPRIDNPAARGAKGLFTYLEESGCAPGVQRSPYTSLPADAKVLIALAPTRRLITPQEWSALQGWIKQGNTFVYAVPRRVRTQYLETALGLRWEIGPRPAPLVTVDALDEGLREFLGEHAEPSDPGGADAVPWLPGGPFSGVERLRVSADDGLESSLAELVPLAGAGDTAFALAMPMEAGELVVLAGTDLAENRRVALGDNLRFWTNLAARGRVYFDEFHHFAPEQSGRGLFATLGPAVGQLLLLGLLLALATGRRLGRPRAAAVARRRSQSEYLAQLSRLYGRASVDGELCGELYRSLRGRLFERLAIGAGLDDFEVARRIEQRAGVAPERYLALARRAHELSHGGASAQEFAQLSREMAELERALGCS